MARFAVIGLGRFGEELAKALIADGAEVLAIDRRAALIERIRDEVTLAVRLDSTDPEALRAQGIDEVEAAIVGIGEDFESAALTVATLQDLGVRRIYARAETRIQARIMLKVGAHAVVSPHRESALRWAHRLMLPNLQQYIELGEGHSMIYAVAPSVFHNKTLLDLQLRRKYGVNLIAIKRTMMVPTGEGESTVEESVLSIPSADTRILPGDILIVVGSNTAVSRLPQD
ncbi:MAG: TrkA family potassium uptake protein [Phycisphaerae bacterium]|nr:TrkA family potassium uptake protein [Phycisphaerae bacterium]